MAYPELPYSIQNWRLEEILDAASVRHCLVGDLVVRALGFPLIPSSAHLAIADEQLENARSILVASRDYQELPQTLEGFFDKRATKEGTTGWPGYRFLPEDAEEWTTSTIIMPASFWRLDLSPESWKTNTVPIMNAPCRFPQKLIYLKALIDIVVDRYEVNGLNERITGYFECHLVYILSYVKDVIPNLPTEDQFFLDLFYKVPLRSTRKKVCDQRRRIGAGFISPEAARALIPRKDLQLEAIRAKYKAVANTPTLDDGSSAEPASSVS